jgi:hypothetical protein
MPSGTSIVKDVAKVWVSMKYRATRHGKKYGASGTMLPIIRGTVCRNLERRSGRIAAGCAKVNGITVEDSQISPVTRKYFARMWDPAPAGPRLQRDPGSTRARSAAEGSTSPGVVLLAVHAGTLVVLGPLDAALLGCANMTVGRRIGLLAIHVRLAALQ